MTAEYAARREAEIRAARATMTAPKHADMVRQREQWLGQREDELVAEIVSGRAARRKKPPSDKLLRAIRRGAKETALLGLALDQWFATSGTSMDDLIAAIDRWQPGDKETDGMGGLHPEVIMPVVDHPEIHPDWKILVCRAMQFVAIKRVAARKAATRQGALLIQTDLFAWI
jgi:hypothetical protein